MPTIQVRTNGKLKKDVQKVLRDIGLDLSSAINVYLRQIVIVGGLPFRVRTVNGFYPEEERRLLQDLAETKRSGKRYATAEEAHRDILGDAAYDAWKRESAARRAKQTLPQRRASRAKGRHIRHRGTRCGRCDALFGG